MQTEHEKKAPLAEFMLSLKHEGLSGDDIVRFRSWLHDNWHVWHAFEAVALKHQAEGKRGSAKWVLEIARESLKIEILNASTPILARMFNFKHACQYFETGKIKAIKLTKRAA